MESHDHGFLQSKFHQASPLRWVTGNPFHFRIPHARNLRAAFENSAPPTTPPSSLGRRPGELSNTGVGTERAASERALPERLPGSAQPEPAVMSATRTCSGARRPLWRAVPRTGAPGRKA